MREKESESERARERKRKGETVFIIIRPHDSYRDGVVNGYPHSGLERFVRKFARGCADDIKQ